MAAIHYGTLGRAPVCGKKDVPAVNRTNETGSVSCEMCLEVIEEVEADDETNPELEARADGHDTRYYESVEGGA